MNTEDIISSYNKSAREYAQSRIGREDTIELNRFRELLKPGSKVLDVGCAAGRDTRLLKDMGFDVVGMDLADKLIAIAKGLNPDINFITADMCKIPYEDKTFDALWVSAVLHHLEKADMPAALKEFSRVLVPGGLLYVHTKAGNSSLITQERKFVLVTREELMRMLEESGLSKIKIEQKQSKSRPGLSWINAYYRKI